MRIAFALALAAGLVAFAPSAHAEDFTFNVPVRVENMRFAESGILACNIFAGTRQIRSSERTFPVTEGNFRGTLTVTADLPEGDRRDAFTQYACIIYLNFRPAGGALQDGGNLGGPAGFVAQYPLRTGQAIASANMAVSTNIPR